MQLPPQEPKGTSGLWWPVAENPLLDHARAHVRANPAARAPALWLMTSAGPIRVELAPDCPVEEALAQLGRAAQPDHVIYAMPMGNATVLVEDVGPRRRYHRFTESGWATFHPSVVEDGLCRLKVPVLVEE